MALALTWSGMHIMTCILTCLGLLLPPAIASFGAVPGLPVGPWPSFL